MLTPTWVCHGPLGGLDHACSNCGLGSFSLFIPPVFYSTHVRLDVVYSLYGMTCPSARKKDKWKSGTFIMYIYYMCNIYIYIYEMLSLRRPPYVTTCQIVPSAMCDSTSLPKGMQTRKIFECRVFAVARFALRNRFATIILQNTQRAQCAMRNMLGPICVSI